MLLPAAFNEPSDSRMVTNSLPQSGGGILIAEDHRLTANLLKRLLAPAFPSHPVRIAFSAEEALELCQSAPPQVVIMDITLPGMNGIDAVRLIKTTMPAIQVIMHSNMGAAIFVDECMKAGAAAYVLKTSAFAELIPAVAGLLAPKVPDSRQQPDAVRSAE
jgi:DNA-binding NarL/FixJ family response regulator